MLDSSNPKSDVNVVKKHDTPTSANDDEIPTITPINQEILSTKEKKEFCKPLRKIKRRNMSFIFPYTKSLGNVKSLHFINQLKLSTDTPKSVIEKAVIVEETIRDVLYMKMVIGLKSPDTIPVGGFLWKLYKGFPTYHHTIQFDTSNNSEYLVQARELVAPLQEREMDMKPFVYGETFYCLLMKMENAEKGVDRSRYIDSNWRMFPMELQKAVLESNKNWMYYVGRESYKALGKRYPYTCRLVFDEISSMMQLPAKEGVVEDPLTIRRRESKERYIQRIWDDLYDPVVSKKRKFSNMYRILEENVPRELQKDTGF